jgi:alpha-beta hydrolase superfamily lysophospholipase
LGEITQPARTAAALKSSHSDAPEAGLTGWLKKLLARMAWALAGILAAGLLIYILQARSLPDLQSWHRGDLARHVVPELSHRELSQASLRQYLQHEEVIFDSLARVVANSEAELPRWHRYNRGAFNLYRSAWPDGNRTQYTQPELRRGAALLAHGLSDSTHSMRPIAASLAGIGFETLNLRMPGHGTVPGALLNVNWRHFRSAYRMGVLALAESLQPGQPLVLVGYSNGAALAVDYTLQALLDDAGLPRPDLLVLISPAMQVAPVAEYARVQRWMSELPGLEKLGWTDVVPEFDPFKYNSFPVYAGEQIYRLTRGIGKRLDRLTSEQRRQFPPLIAFQSVVDATIPPTSILAGLFDKLEDNTSMQLVLFDVNRQSAMLPLLNNRADELLDELASRGRLPFDLTVVGSPAVSNPDRATLRRKAPGASAWVETESEMFWPPGVFSLSHVALPFSPEDEVYGPNRGDGLLRLGDMWFKGERGVFGVPLGLLARQRYNPFFPYLQERVLGSVESLVNDGVR